jgi:hypothetical protein
MYKRHLEMCIAMTFSALLLFSCGSSSGGGIGGSGIISRGTITEFGSIVVNGTVFDTTDASIYVDGQKVGTGDLTAQERLDVGRIVTVEGISEDEETAVADRVTYDENVKGPIQAISIDNPQVKEIVVMGQTVVLNALTKFENTSFATIAVNDMVEVSGLYDEQGTIWAGFLEKTGLYQPNTIVEVSGFVMNLNTDLATFDINDLTVDYSAADTGALPAGVPAEGLLVEAEGTLNSTGEMLTATLVELEDEVDAENADEIEITGFVTDVASALEFTLGNQNVIVESGAEFVDGTLADITLGQKLEAEGTLTESVLYAHEIEFWEPDQIEVEGLVTAVISLSEFVIGDQTVMSDADTVYENVTSQTLEVGMNIEIKGRLVDDILYADKVSLEED